MSGYDAWATDAYWAAINEHQTRAEKAESERDALAARCAELEGRALAAEAAAMAYRQRAIRLAEVVSRQEVDNGLEE